MIRLLTLGWLLLLGPGGGMGRDVASVGPEPASKLLCYIKFEYNNTLDQDVWIRWDESTLTRDIDVLTLFDNLYDPDKPKNERIPPGEQSWSRGDYNGVCNTLRSFSIRVSFGSIELPVGGWIPASNTSVEIRRVSGKGEDYERSDDSGFFYGDIDIPLGESACWLKALQEATHIRSGDPATGCTPAGKEEKKVDRLFMHRWGVGPVCDEGSGEVGRPPSSRICASADIPIRGLDTCVFNETRMPCTWWGFEFEYENARTDVPLTCVMNRSRPGTEGNFEGVRSRGLATDTIHFALMETRGQIFYPLFEVHTDDITWPVVDVEIRCSYGGYDDQYWAKRSRRLIFSEGIP